MTDNKSSHQKNIEQRQTLSPQKQALLAKRLQGKASPLADRRITPVAAGAIVPVSYSQQRLWFVQQLDPAASWYNRSTRLKITGELDVERLEQALNHIIARHAVLRTAILQQADELCQEVIPPSNVDLHQEDFSQLEPLALEERIGSLVEQPFDLSSGKLVRLYLFRLAQNEYLLLFVTHHVAFDRWSEDVFIKELEAAYQARSLPELPIQYADFATWQRSAEQETRLEPHLAYWKEQLGGELPLLKLPEDHTRPAIQGLQGGSVQIILPAALLQSLKDLARGQGCTLFMLLLAAYKVLLFRNSGQTDLIVGSPIAGRLRPEVEPLIGCFINNLVLRTDLSGTPTFTELLKRLRKVTLEAYQHQEVPFELLVRVLQTGRDMSHSPLFQTMFNFENIPQVAQQKGASGFQLIEMPDRVALYDLSVGLIEQDDCLVCNFIYSIALFAPETIQRLAGHYLTLLESILANPQESITSLPMLTAAERQTMLFDWNETRVDLRENLCLHQLFEKQAALKPDNIAMIFEDQQFSYRELEQHSNRLAHHLQALGVGAEVMVGIYLERSPEMVICVLAVLKAGGAFMPLETSHPTARTKAILENSQAPVVLTRQGLVSCLDGYAGHLVLLDTHSNEIAAQASSQLESPVCPDNLAYVIHTSGTTGVPKGVLLHHRGAANIVMDSCTKFAGVPGDRFLLNFPLSFDTSVWQIFLPFTVGAKLILVEPDRHNDAAWLLGLVAKHKISFLNVTSSMLDNMLVEYGLENYASLRLVICGTEVTSLALVDRFFKQRNDCELFNTYGPTEASISTTHWRCQTGGLNGLVPIGRPFANTRTYILDEYLQPVPVGVPGELHLAGICVGRGYLNRPDLTADKFIPDPFFPKPGGRMYKTGDRARYLPDGNIDFLGRIDQQVKIRGFRIELGEIETALTEYAELLSVVVVPVQKKNQIDSLAAYFVSKKGSNPNVSELRTFLKARLPDYMLPAYFIPLDALPHTHHGKLDRSLLPAPDQSRPELEQPFVSARTPTEKKLVSIWTEVLDLKQVGILDNFFDLGGHSLLATKILSQILINLGVDLPLRRMFEAPTIAATAAEIDAIKTNRMIPQAEMIRPVSHEKYRKTREAIFPGRSIEGSNLPLSSVRSPQDRGAFSFPVSFAQQMMWILDQLDPGNPAYNVVSAFRLTGKLNVKALEESLNTILQRHESLRTTFSLQDDQPVQVVAPFKPVFLPVTSLEHLPEPEQTAETRLLLERTAAHSFNLSDGPLFHILLVKLPIHEHLLIFNMHHIIFDGWSFNVLWRELSSLYAAYSQGLANPLPDLPTQYPDFSVWQRDWLQGSVLSDHLAYWKQKLADVPALELPVDRPRPAVFTHQGDNLTFEISSRLSAALKEFSRKNNVTLYMTLLAAFKVLLYRYTGQRDVAVGTFSANRNRVEIEGLIGFFVNTLVLRTQIHAQSSFSNLLQDVRKNTLETYAHQDLPFEKLVAELHPSRDLGRNPFFQIAFNSPSMSAQELDLVGLEVGPVKISTRSAKMDLSFGIENRPDGLEFSINYYSALFNEDFIQRMAGHYITLLESILANPHETIARLTMLSATERQHMLVDWNETRVERPGNQCLHQLFEKQAALKPDNVALIFEDQQVSYAQLEQRSNQLARHLQTLGVGPEVMVGIYLERSPEMVTCVLAVLKAGGAFVPLDTSYPAARTTVILKNSQAPVVLTRQGLVSGLGGYAGHLVLLDADADEISRQAVTPVGSGVGPDDLAYVIHTSGTTGIPKGVLIHHGGASNLIQDMCAQLGFVPEDRFLLNFPLSFDVGISQIFLPFTVAGRLIVVQPERHNDPSHLLSLIAKHAITILNTSSSMLENILVEYGLSDQPSLRLVICGAESTSLSLVNHFFEQTDIELINIYGPTEVSMAVTFWRCQPGGLDGAVPIGLPMANIRAYALDENLQPVPVGVPGELYLAGIGLGRGYLGLPDLTAEKFIPEPFSSEPGQRMYKTGDLVRYLPGGNIEFLSRVDQQVKIRGFRIELGEIETSLESSPMVRKCAVVVREDLPGDKRLVAYIIPNPEFVPTGTSLREYLAEKLPFYMLPNHFVFMDKIPLTNNGKANYALLPAPDPTRPKMDQAIVLARTPTEKNLVAIWTEVLGLEQVSILDNFFDLGGHSLLATRIIAHILASHGVNLPLRLMFENPTIAQLAVEIDIINAGNQNSQAVTIQPVSRQKYRKTH